MKLHNNMKEKDKKKTSKSPSRFNEFCHSEVFKFVSGLLILLIASILLMAFLSFIVTGKADQAVIENLAWSDILNKGNGITNWTGSFGAFAAEYLINRWIGISAFLYVFLLFRMGYSLLKGISIRPLGVVFVKYAVWSIWISAFFGFVSYVLSIEDNFIYLGGHHGYDLCQLLHANIGWPGVVLILLVTFILLSLVSYRARTISSTRSVFNGFHHSFSYLRIKAKERMEKRAAKKAAEEAKAAERAAKEAAKAAEEAAAKDATGEPVTDKIMDENSVDGVEQESVQEQAPVAEEPQADTMNPTATDTPSTDDTFQVPAATVVPAANPAKPVTPLDMDITVAPATVQATEQQLPPQEDYDPTAELAHYKFPTVDLLKQYAESVPVDLEEQNANKEKIRQTLSDYGIEIQSISAMVGPTITLFEIVLETGTKISRVRNLQDEIAMCIAASAGVRIIAPIPGKAAIGIEVPNKDPQTVSMRSCIMSRAFQESKMELPVALGKTITNEVFTFDLAKMPHLLVAGATGQGKSVGLNAILTSLLYKKHPSQLKIVLVDPKQVEFSIYSRIDKHYLARLADEVEPIITDTTRVVSTLQSLCVEMEDRYALVKDAELRNIKEYNAKFIHRELNPKKLIKSPLGSRDGVHHHYMPYIVVVIDEYGDLIMTAGKEIELPIARIAQKARAVGIHMIIATQRPSAKIITGTIKANFPARIAFRVSSAVDSGIILDQSGAQNLIGRGDLLFSTGQTPVRVQCAFVDTPEVDTINRYIAQQESYPTPFILPDPPVGEGGGDDGGQGGGVDLNQLDPMFNEAAELVVSTGQGSTSMIQRKFAIGYNRAGRIMDQLEAAGIVGPYTGSKARAVLIDSDTELQNILIDLKNR